MSAHHFLPGWLHGVMLAFVGSVGCGSFAQPPGLNSGAMNDAAAASTQDASLDGTLPPRMESPTTPYDISVVLPYQAPEVTVDLVARSDSARLDVHISVDTTASFMPEIMTIQRDLVDTVVPGLRVRVPDLAIGISRFADFPVAPFGAPTDHLYDLLTGITTDFTRVSLAVQRLLPLQNGADDPEGWDEALYQIATGAGFTSNGVEYAQPFLSSDEAQGGGSIPGVGFRQGSSRVVMNITDAPAHEPGDYLPGIPGVHGTAAVGIALAAVGAHFIGIAADDDPRPQMVELCTATNAIVPLVSDTCPMGVSGASIPPVNGACPLVFDIDQDGTGLSDALLNSIASFLDHQEYARVFGQAVSDPQSFVTAIEATTDTPPSDATPPTRADLVPVNMPDGILDTFENVPTQTEVDFRLHLRNTSTPTSEYPQVFYVTVQILGDGIVLSQQTVRVIVPEGPKPDSGVDAPPLSDMSSVGSSG